MLFRQGGTNHEIVRIIGYSSADASGFDVMLLAFSTYLPINPLEPAFGEYQGSATNSCWLATVTTRS